MESFQDFESKYGLQAQINGTYLSEDIRLSKVKKI